jgi:hypothetical protein
MSWTEARLESNWEQWWRGAAVPIGKWQRSTGIPHCQ